jgi:hypothetical protein
MNTTLIVSVALALGMMLGAVLTYVIQHRRSARLEQEFGPEYGRVVAETGNRLKAEAQLIERQKRVRQFHIRPLTTAEQASFRAGWRDVQAKFVDDPATALMQADRLIGEVMSAEGYPILDFEQRAADISVVHSSVIENYREGHAIAIRNVQGNATTEDLRKAMIHYRAVFEGLTGQPEQLLEEKLRV